MKKRALALLLGVVLCFGLISAAYAKTVIIEVNGQPVVVEVPDDPAPTPEPTPAPTPEPTPKPPHTGGGTYIPSTPDDTTTTTTTNPDGSTTTTVTNKTTGVVTETTKYPNGDETKTVTQKDGTKTFDNKNADGTTASGAIAANGKVDASVKVSDKAVTDAAGKPVVVPVPTVPVVSSSAEASTVKVDLPAGVGSDSVYVTVPVSGTNPGTVAVLVKADGTEEVVKKSVLVDGKLIVPVEDGATVKIMDKSTGFSDTNDHWAGSNGAVAFVTSHGLFEGVGDGKFAPNSAMTRGMLVTVLHRLEDTPISAGMSFTDVGSSWYTEAVAWASASNIVSGYGDGKFGPDDNVTREQIAKILYGYATQVLGLEASERGSLVGFPDGANTSAWAQDAMSWAVGAGLFQGDNAGRLNPGGNATRAQVATLLMRFVEYIAK